MVGQAVHRTTLGRADHNIDPVDLNTYHESFSGKWHPKCLKKWVPFPKLHEINSLAREER